MNLALLNLLIHINHSVLIITDFSGFVRLSVGVLIILQESFFMLFLGKFITLLFLNNGHGLLVNELEEDDSEKSTEVASEEEEVGSLGLLVVSSKDHGPPHTEGGSWVERGAGNSQDSGSVAESSVVSS